MALPPLPDIPRRDMPVDVKENRRFLPNLNYVPIDPERVANDRCLIETVTDPHRHVRALRVQLKSEVGGPFGVRNPYRAQLDALAARGAISSDEIVVPALQILNASLDLMQGYSEYVFYLTAKGEIYLRKTPPSRQGTTAAHDGTMTFNVGRTETERKRAVMIVASALANYGFIHEDDGLLDLATALYDHWAELQTLGDALPSADQIQVQVQEERPEFDQSDYDIPN